MFELALRAQLPLVSVYTDDVVNTEAVVLFILKSVGASYAELPKVKSVESIKKCMEAYVLSSAIQVKQCSILYNVLLECEKTLIFINPEHEHPLLFNAGELPTPKEMIFDVLKEVGFSLRQIDSFLPALGGLNLLQIGEVCRLAMAKNGDLTSSGIANMKMTLYTGRGLVGVNTDQGFYLPCDKLRTFVDSEGGFFLNTADKQLRPRGVLLHGMPGTGKSQAAKYLANNWGVPLFIVDMASIMGKYVGESENNMRDMLAKADREAPCVLLFDEIEKIFTSSEGDTGVTTRLLGQLLWWMQEHDSVVFTMMTSNNIKKLPKELYRLGRMDSVIKIPGLFKQEGLDFSMQVLATFDGVVESQVCKQGVRDLYLEQETVSHVTIIGVVTKLVKEAIMNGSDYE